MRTTITCPTGLSQDAKVTLGNGSELTGVTEAKVELLPGELNKVTLRLINVDLNVQGRLYVIDPEGKRQEVEYIQLSNGERLF